MVAEREVADDDDGRTARTLASDEVGRGGQFVDDVLDRHAEFAAVAVGFAAPVAAGVDARPADGDAALAVPEGPPAGVGDDDLVGGEALTDALGALGGPFREQKKVRAGHVRAVDPGVDTDVAEPRLREEERCLHDDLGALFEDGLGESGVFLLPADVAEAGGEFVRPRPGREVLQVCVSALRLRDDRGGDADHVVGAEVDPLADEGREVVSRLNLREVGDGEQFHTRDVWSAVKRPPKVAKRTGVRYGGTTPLSLGTEQSAMTHVVTAFLRRRGRLLLVHRSQEVGTYQGLWGGVSGYVEGDPADALDDARRELREEVGVTDATLVRAGSTVTIVDGDREWTVHPFLFDWPVAGDLALNEELTATEWIHAPTMQTRETVPGLWQAYEAVAPSVETVRDDRRHGSAYISVRALEVLRDRAAVADDWAEAAAVARGLRDARPSMAALANRVNRAMSEAARSPEAVSERATTAVDDAVRADDEAAENASAVLSEAETVLTLSRSGTVTAALSDVPKIVVAESRPAREGVEVAEELAGAGADVTLVADAAIGFVLTEEDVDAAVVGADTVFPDGSVANKIGTRLLALAAAREGVPCYVVTARDKVSPSDDFHPEFGERESLYEGESGLDVLNPTFDRTPSDLVTGVVTEGGVLDVEEVMAVADEHRRFAEWAEDG